VNLTQRLTEADLRFIVETVADRRQDHDRIIELVRDKEDFLEVMLQDDRLVRRVLEDEEILLKISPFLLFTILMRRVRKDLQAQGYTIERVGIRESVPVFDAPQVSEFLKEPEVEGYLVDLLVSFTRINTWTLYFYRHGQFQRRRFSDLNLDDMIELANLVEEEARFPIYKRVADIALFISGIFPEYAASRKRRSERGPLRMLVSTERLQSLEDYEEEGKRFYHLAAGHPTAKEIRLDRVLASLAEHFSFARKPLNLLSDRYIRWSKSRLFGGLSAP